ncbi:uncharacterized protein [Clytia hemisphaerica]
MNEQIFFPREVFEEYKGSHRKQARPYKVFSGLNPRKYPEESKAKQFIDILFKPDIRIVEDKFAEKGKKKIHRAISLSEHCRVLDKQVTDHCGQQGKESSARGHQAKECALTVGDKEILCNGDEVNTTKNKSDNIDVAVENQVVENFEIEHALERKKDVLNVLESSNLSSMNCGDQESGDEEEYGEYVDEFILTPPYYSTSYYDLVDEEEDTIVEDPISESCPAALSNDEDRKETFTYKPYSTCDEIDENKMQDGDFSAIVDNKQQTALYGEENQDISVSASVLLHNVGIDENEAKEFDSSLPVHAKLGILSEQGVNEEVSDETKIDSPDGSIEGGTVDMKTVDMIYRREDNALSDPTTLENLIKEEILIDVSVESKEDNTILQESNEKKHPKRGRESTSSLEDESVETQPYEKTAEIEVGDEMKDQSWIDRIIVSSDANEKEENKKTGKEKKKQRKTKGRRTANLKNDHVDEIVPNHEKSEGKTSQAETVNQPATRRRSLRQKKKSTN